MCENWKDLAPTSRLEGISQVDSHSTDKDHIFGVVLLKKIGAIHKLAQSCRPLEIYACTPTHPSTQWGCESDDDSHEKSTSYYMWLWLDHLRHYTCIRLCFLTTEFHINLMSIEYYWKKYIHNPNNMHHHCNTWLLPGCIIGSTMVNATCLVYSSTGFWVVTGLQKQQNK